MKNKNVYVIQTIEQYNEDEIKKSYQQLVSKYDNFKTMIKKGETVLIKPNFVAPSIKATTNLFLLNCMIETLLDIGSIPIIAESSGFEFSTEETFRILKIKENIKDSTVKIVNLDKEEFVEVESGNPHVPIYLLPKLVFEVDRIIDMPRLKGHSLTKVTFSIKNLFGLLHRETRRKIHATDLELGIRYLRNLVKIDFILVDGLWNLNNAVYSEAKYWGILVCGEDTLSVDMCCCDIYGVDYKTVPHIDDGTTKTTYQVYKLTDICNECAPVKEKNFYRKQNVKYKLMYFVDLYFSKVFNKSLIPYLHYYGGIRPHINKRKCSSCGKCQDICPVNAIDNKKIQIEKCINVRCMKCYNICPNHAIEKKGFHKS